MPIRRNIKSEFLFFILQKYFQRSALPSPGLSSLNARPTKQPLTVDRSSVSPLPGPSLSYTNPNSTPHSVEI